MWAPFKSFVRRMVRRCGYDIVSYGILRNHDLRRAKLLQDACVTVVLDGGANEGQYAKHLRSLGYEGRIVSVEPIPAVFQALEHQATNDPNWVCVNAALGERDSEVAFNVAEISQVSSILKATGIATTSQWTATREQSVRMRRLNELLPEVSSDEDVVYLKLDIQGYEKHALLGAEEVLDRIHAVELELSTVRLYEDESLVPELFSLLDGWGFGLYSIDTVMVDYVRGQVLQLEGIFLRHVDLEMP